ncbi:hypothetical protein [Paracoccus fontiphilus]|uniref:hypothetical protein n=1 Tax=Paracoccus fontiphilus TaxID=1815556 RepID=UPI001A972B35|nr:hypothetical protein [Paracoccus fontiphilus]
MGHATESDLARWQGIDSVPNCVEQITVILGASTSFNERVLLLQRRRFCCCDVVQRDACGTALVGLAQTAETVKRLAVRLALIL